MYGIIWCLNLPDKIGDLETLILLTSCICHDLDHPGFNNIYQVCVSLISFHFKEVEISEKEEKKEHFHREKSIS
jgi:hypothetical protein